MPSSLYEPQPVILPFTVKYEGKDADQHIIKADMLGHSIVGASKLYNSIAHYCAFGYVPPKGNYKKEFACYANIPRSGGYDIPLFIAQLSNEYNLHSAIYKDAIGLLFPRIIWAVKQIWTRKGKTTQVVEELTHALIEQAKINAEVETQLVNALTKANDNLASLQSQLIDQLPRLAENNRNNAKEFVTPIIGNSVVNINQFSGTNDLVKIDGADAEAINNDDMEVDEMQKFHCLRITEVNIRTGHCIMEIEGYEKPVSGVINDPVISTPHNIYTKSLDNGASFTISAKPVRKNGELYKLYVSDAK